MTRLNKLLLICFLLGISPGLGWAQESLPFPEGCGNPFVPDGAFGDFYEKTIQSAVIESGVVSPAHVNLFAVNALRKYMSAKYPNPADGEAIDKHLRAQLCSYGTGKQGLTSSSIELHRHLASISTRLLGDLKRLTGQLIAKEKERQKSMEKFERRYGLIERAEKMGEGEVNTFLR